MEFAVHRYDSVESTNAIVRSAIEEGEAEGFACRARTQVGGYGRQGRSWSSPFGGLYQSVLLRPKRPIEELPTLGLVTALAISDALDGIEGTDHAALRVKWPNDILVGEAKLVGISCESHKGAICIGFGVNVFQPLVVEPIGGKNTPAYLFDDVIGKDRAIEETASIIDSIGDAILSSLSRYYERWTDQGFRCFLPEYSDRGCLEGRPVELLLANGSSIASGTTRGIDEKGRLLVETEGKIRPFSSGEVHIL